MKCPKFVAVVIKTGEIAHKKPPPLHEKPISCGGGGLCDSSVAQETTLIVSLLSFPTSDRESTS
jgi:hypothetical protein